MLRSLALATLISGLAITAALADDHKDYTTVNKSVTLDDGDRADKVSSVNGSVKVRRGAQAREVSSVNGSIDISRDAEVGSVGSVNGGIDIGENVNIDRGVESVNGGIEIGDGTEVGGDLTTVNGRIEAGRVLVDGDVITVNGNLRFEGTEVNGDVRIEKPSSSWNFWRKEPKPVKVYLGDDTIIHGRLVFERPVELELSERAQVAEIIGEEHIQ